MTGSSPAVYSAEATIVLAEKVIVVLREHSVDALVIGGHALAVHNFMRSTGDLDLGVSTPVSKLRAIAADLTQRGWTVEFRPPEGDDPLGGVIDIDDGLGGYVQIINFDNRPIGGFPAVIEDALKAIGSRPSNDLRAIPLPHLIALKLYAGGPKSERDVRELLRNNPDADLQEIRKLCTRYRLPTAILQAP